MTIPKSLGRYDVVDLIGKGGMGALYRAKDPLIGRYVAIKLLRRDYDTEEIRSRFAREARAAGSLSHPNIVTIYDVGEYDGLPFIAMEYVAGETFADLVCLRPPLPLTRKLQLTEEVCAGLAHAHEAGIVHRDIKPANLIVGPEGIVKILDFGIAKLSTSAMTRPGAVVGSLNYMSPEQVKGEPVDARSDIFSLGAVLYELLSHQRAFPGEAHHEAMQQILTGVARPLTDYCPDLDARLVHLVGHALEHDADRRFQEIAELQQELTGIRLELVGGAPRSGRSSGVARSGSVAPPPSPARRPPTPGPRQTDPNSQRIEEHLNAAELAHTSGHVDAAIESCKQVLLLDSSNPRAIALIARVHAGIDEQQAMELLVEAREHLSRGEATMAWGSLESADQLSPHHPDIATARDEALATRARIAQERADKAARQAAEEEAERVRQQIAALIGHASQCLTSPQADAGALVLALRDVKQVLVLDAENADAPPLQIALEGAIAAHQEAARTQAAIDNARRRFANGKHQSAIQLLADFQPSSSPEIISALEDLRRALHDIEAQRQAEQERIARQQRIDALVADAQQALHDQRFGSALELLASAHEIDPTAPEIPPLILRVGQERAAAQRSAQVGQVLEQLDTQIALGDLASAADRLAAASALSADDPRVRSAAQRLELAVAARAAAEARSRELDEQLAATETLLDGGDLDGAARRLQRAATLDAQHPRTVHLAERFAHALEERKAAEEAERQEHAIDELMGTATRHLASADAPKATLAMQILGQVLAMAPDHAGALALKVTVERALADERERARVRAAIGNARARFANGKHAAALQMLENFDASADPEVAGTLQELRATFDQIQQRRRAEQELAERQRPTIPAAEELTRTDLRAPKRAHPVAAFIRRWRGGH